jgi:radical SAM superfamily enzyme YgiQ (UPF0313 family)
MKVELILPRKDEGRMVDLGCYVVPETLTQLAAVTPREIGGESVELRLTDENSRRADYRWGADLVGISVMTSQVRRAEEISREYRARGASIVWGGIHPTAVDQSGNGLVDSTVRGEGELAWPGLLRDFAGGRLKRSYRSGAPVSLDQIPLPDREALEYPDVRMIVDGVSASRGCPHDCEFCSASLAYGTVLRRRRPERVGEDIARTRSPNVGFFDDNFLVDPAYSLEMMDVMGRYGKRYWAQIDAKKALDPAAAKELAKAGTRLVIIGFESVNASNLRGNRKYVPPRQWKRIAENLHAGGIRIDGNFVFGFDDDGPEVFGETARWVEHAGLDYAAASILTPYPGTRLHDRLSAEGRIIDDGWDNYDLRHVVYSPRRMTPERLQEGAEAFKRSHPSVFLHLGGIFG